jgi:yeast amino acid transporter
MAEKYDEKQYYGDGQQEISPERDYLAGEVSENADNLHRKLGNRQIQLIAIGGSIGTALFVSMGSALNKGGPGSLLIAFILYSLNLALVNNGMAEMAVQ